MFVSKNPCGPHMNPCRPEAKPSGGIWSRWVPLAFGFALGMSILSHLCTFPSHWVTKANAIYGEIPALDPLPTIDAGLIHDFRRGGGVVQVNF